jgi:F-type H+-transporting ATPase subunit delta
MSAVRLANRYAKSVLDLGSERGSVQSILADVRRIQNDINENRDLELLLKSPIIHADKKLSILKSIYSDGMDPVIMELIEILVRKRREAYLQDILAAFIKLYNDQQNIRQVKITTAVPISDDLKEQIANTMRAGEDAQIELEVEVDPELIGGYIVRYDDKQYDASVIRNLQSLRAEFDRNTYVKKY